MSTELTKTEREKFQILLMKAVDEDLSKNESSEFERFIAEYPECRLEWRQQKKIKEVTKNMKFKNPPQEVWDRYWVNVYNRLERGVAWIVFSLGFVILLTYGGFKAVEAIIADPQLAGIVKMGVILSIGGLVLLLVSVLREKIFMFRRDPYKEVKR